MNLIKYKVFLFVFLSVLLSNLFQAKADITKSYPFQETRNDIGLIYDFAWDKKNKKIIIKRDKENYPVIRFSLFDKKNFPAGVSVKKYNNVNLSKISDKEIQQLHKINKSAKLTLGDNKIFTLEPYAYDYNNIKLSSFNLEYINNIDTNKGLLEISFEADIANSRPDLNKLFDKLSADGLLEDNLLEFRPEWGHYPIRVVEIKEYKYDVDIRKGIKTPEPNGDIPIFFTYDDKKVRTIRRESGIGQFRQEFDFKKFPFDKQKLKIKIASGARSTSIIEEAWPYTGKAAVHFITPDKGAFLGLENYLNNVSEQYLKEWSVKSVNIKSEEIIVENFYNKYLNKTHSYSDNTIDLILNIERNSAYYIYKIIIPVFLILSIAWFVLWIPTHKLDARLTTSVVAFLSLIAYIFVFSDDIPKLNYLTALDEYILLSYVFCCFPIVMSILFSRFIIKNQKKVILINKRLRALLGIIYLVFTIQIFSF